MEKLNLCTPDGQRLPDWIEREKPIPDGCGIQVVSIWVRDPQGQLLITRRAAVKIFVLYCSILYYNIVF